MGTNGSKRSNPFSRRRTAAKETNPNDVTVRLQRPNTAATADSAFFQMLPPELRRLVLVYGFGDRTLHVVPPACVCRRRMFGDMDVWGEFSSGGKFCTAEYWSHNRQQTRKEPKEVWMIGVMPWLRCCRQAYLEGVEVFYATNTFHVSGEVVAQSPLAHYLPTAHLASVSSLEWVISTPWHCPEENMKDPELGNLKGFFQALPFALPRLQRLYVGFWPCPALWPSPEAYRAASFKEKYLVYTEQLLVPIDTLIIEGLGDRLTELEIGIPTSAFKGHFTRGMVLGYKFELSGWTPDAAKNSGSRGKGPGGQGDEYGARLIKPGRHGGIGRERRWTTWAPCGAMRCLTNTGSETVHVRNQRKTV